MSDLEERFRQNQRNNRSNTKPKILEGTVMSKPAEMQFWDAAIGNNSKIATLAKEALAAKDAENAQLRQELAALELGFQQQREVVLANHKWHSMYADDEVYVEKSDLASINSCALALTPSAAHLDQYVSQMFGEPVAEVIQKDFGSHLKFLVATPLPVGMVLYAKRAATLVKEALPIRGSHIKSNWFHGAGACAQCSYCKRYSDNPKALEKDEWPCDCGKLHGWSGSFIPPTAESRWSDATVATHEPLVGDGQGARAWQW